MATILMVHGTFANGPEDGASWWQRGSTCHNDVADLVEGDGSSLTILPVSWTGLNSEQARQVAASELLTRMTELERAGEQYCVIGHSHGGSIISAALLHAAHGKSTLANLSRWITIGTPFIETRKSRLVFSRLSRTGKTIFLSVLSLCAFAIYLLVGLSNIFSRMGMGTGGTSSSIFDTSNIIAMGAILLLTMFVIWLIVKGRLFWHNTSVQLFARKNFADKWLALYHEDDEAIQGLGAFRVVRHNLFPKDFAVSPILAASAFIVPLAPFLGLFAAGSLPRSFVDSYPGAMLILMLILLLFSPLLAFAVLYILASPLSYLSSRILNYLVWAQFQSSSLGNDIDGELALYARADPIWAKRVPRPLPDELANDIATVSDESASATMAKLRDALSELSFYNCDQGAVNSLSHFLSGQELIHTSYFSLQRFRKLLAFAIAKSPGFRSSARLSNDPQFKLIERWYHEITAREGAEPTPVERTRTYDVTA